jgi:hypothetical protein
VPRSVSDPIPLWCWSLVTRSDDDRPGVLALRDNAGTLTRAAGLHVIPDGRVWLPKQDPHRAEIAARTPKIAA